MANLNILNHALILPDCPDCGGEGTVSYDKALPGDIDNPYDICHCVLVFDPSFETERKEFSEWENRFTPHKK